MDPKKRQVGASERDEWLRAAWRTLLAEALEAGRLVFVDEMGANTSLAPLHAWSRRGERAHCSVPRNRGKNTTLLASMTSEGMGPCLAGVGGTTKEVFEAPISVQDAIDGDSSLPDALLRASRSYMQLSPTLHMTPGTAATQEESDSITSKAVLTPSVWLSLRSRLVAFASCGLVQQV
jgi:hypothetical protein